MILSKAQRELILEVSKGKFVWTDGGDNLKVWLGDEDAKKIKNIGIKTFEVVIEKGLLVYKSGEYQKDLYKYGLIGDYDFVLRVEGIKL